ncbi:regulatory protein RecX [Salinicola rhizosphaerae]|uniref:Regulatory protein RecX n=1 Tax=Salinicola rhizosphaerae TaxID=1443141 RepID=A0ABQ3E1N3_9GAMM|nr:regulatory protein RecX [Salinicola rhizosphaerae]GHB20580.1 regulatory protein RecX [Salinicola rhizosphaerae]
MTQNAEPDPREIAIQFLARREYSRAELAQRLSDKGVAAEAVAPALDALSADGLQSDERFAEVFVRSRIARGQGPVKVRADIRTRGIDDALVGLALEAEAPDWQELACHALAKRFDGPGATPRERARRERFLAGRGFEFDHVRHAMKYAWG